MAHPRLLLCQTMTVEQQVEVAAFHLSDNMMLKYGMSIQAMVRRTPR
jgi:hypothetical protein